MQAAAVERMQETIGTLPTYTVRIPVLVSCTTAKFPSEKNVEKVINLHDIHSKEILNLVWRILCSFFCAGMELLFVIR